MEKFSLHAFLEKEDLNRICVEDREARTPWPMSAVGIIRKPEETGFHSDSTGHWILCESDTCVKARFGEGSTNCSVAAYVRHQVVSGELKLLTWALAGSCVGRDIGGFFGNREQETDGVLSYSYYLKVLVCIISLTYLSVLIFDGLNGQDIIIPYWYIDGSLFKITHEIILNTVTIPMLQSLS